MAKGMSGCPASPNSPEYVITFLTIGRKVGSMLEAPRCARCRMPGNIEVCFFEELSGFVLKGQFRWLNFYRYPHVVANQSLARMRAAR